ncbi:MAG: GtrA family protein [Lachnospiraceae bacterium]|nr:GtrA family protein [Lachnospiraceae bacterium]
MTDKQKEVLRAVKFGLFSISAGLIEIGSFTLLDLLTPWNYWPKYLIALVLSVIWNFTLNRRYTFKSANNVPVAMAKVAAYYCVFTPLSTLLGNYLAESLGWNEYLVTFINMCLNFVTEFLYDKYFVFRGSIDTNEIAKKEEKNK